VDAHFLSHIAQGHTMKAVLGEEQLSSIQNLFQRFGALRGLRPRRRLGRGRSRFRPGSRHQLDLYSVH
jgi:hypothetical protein